MHLHQILEELAYDGGELPREAIEAAIIKKDEITPYLLEILQDAINHVDEIVENDNYQGHLYAMYLLAQFREKKAFPLILQLISFPGEIPHALGGDIITEDLSRILASIALTDIEPLKRLIEDVNINEYVRAASQSALVTLVGCGIIGRKEILEYFSSLFHNRLEKTPSFVWDNLIAASLLLYPDVLYVQILEAFSQNLIDTTFISLQDIENALQHPREAHLFNLYQNAELIDDTVTEMEKWHSLI